MTPQTAAELLQRVSDSEDAEAFSLLFEHFAPRLKAYMQRQCKDPALAEELAQEALTTVWRKAALYSSDRGSPATWIFTIARNLRIDRIRRERAWEPLPDEFNEQASDAPLPDDNVSRNQRVGALRAALSELPDEQRQVIELSFISGMSHSEIADHLSLPIGTIKSRMRLAYDKLRPLLQHVY